MRCTRSANRSSREDRTTQGTLAEPEQNRRASRAVRGGWASAQGVLPGGADPENARGEDQGRRAKGGLPFSTAGAPRARTQLGHREPLLKHRSALGTAIRHRKQPRLAVVGPLLREDCIVAQESGEESVISRLSGQGCVETPSPSRSLCSIEPADPMPGHP